MSCVIFLWQGSSSISVLGIWEGSQQSTIRVNFKEITDGNVKEN